MDISSPENSRFKCWKSLLGRRGIKRYGKALVSGSKIVLELMRIHPEIVDGCLFSERNILPLSSFLSETQKYRLTSDLFRELDVYGTGYPLLLVNIPAIHAFDPDSPHVGLSLLIPFQDPVNVGAVIRSAVAFGIRKIVLLKEAAHPYHPKSIRAGGTAVFLVSYSSGPSIHDIKQLPFPVVALSSDGIPVSRFTFPGTCALLPGIEGPGLPGDITPDYMVSVPIDPEIESLNAAVAVSIVLYEYQRRYACPNTMP
ncbi:TrmH family RNA methyltransferase [Candidatus Latescibacterota bacterium]